MGAGLPIPAARILGTALHPVLPGLILHIHVTSVSSRITSNTVSFGLNLPKLISVAVTKNAHLFTIHRDSLLGWNASLEQWHRPCKAGYLPLAASSVGLGARPRASSSDML